MDRAWTWEHEVPPRWLLADEYSGDLNVLSLPMALCAEIDGLFVDPEPPAAETYTLLGCDPASSLREVLRHIGTDRAWLPRVILDPLHDFHQPPPADCHRYDRGCSCAVELMDVQVIGHRPSIFGAGLVDIDLRGHSLILPEQHWPPAQPIEGTTGFLLSAHDDQDLGRCHSTAGVFRERRPPPLHPVTLIGCRPEPPLRALLAHPSPHRRRLQVALYAVDQTGLAVPTGQALFATVTDSRSSRLSEELLDITLDGGIDEPFPTGARKIWQMWHHGGPTQPNLWAAYDRVLRHEWAGAALWHHRQERPDLPSGYTFHLDGRFVTDVEGFYCAVGEAVNGPGGYFGWNLDALADCVQGEWGAAAPFHLVWHHAEVARRYLIPGYDRPPYDQRRWGPATTLHDLLDILADGGSTIDLR